MARSEASTELDPFARPDEALGAEPHAYLVVREADGTRVVEIAEGKDLVIGRAEDAAIAVADPRVSRQHAMFARRDGALSVRDLESRNTTAVNGRPLEGESRALGAGDVVHIGPVEVVVAVASAQRRPAPEPLATSAVRPGSGETTAPDDFASDAIVADVSMVRLFETVRRVAKAPTTVLVVGETGVGKEIVAEQIHRWSDRAKGPFVRLNCASLPETLLESELFGHEKGAFTGADAKKLGYFEAAAGGTILFDEVGELPLAMQAKLLRVLETRQVAPVGGTRERSVDVRVIGATHRDLEADAAAGKFRSDLFYRLGGFTLRVPPLRERPVEVRLLAELFARRIAQAIGTTTPPVFDSEACAVLERHQWPGNVRELRNAVEHAVILAGAGPIRAEHLPESVRRPRSLPPEAESDDGMRDRVADVEKKSIEDALAAVGGNQTRAALKLGISRGSLVYKMTKYGLR